MIDLNKVNKIYFIGIGGIGISAVAGIMHVRSFIVEGSDAAETDIVSDLRAHQIPVHVPHNADHLSNLIDLVVYSVAVPETNVELIRAKELGLPTLTYPQLLGLLIEKKFGIGISGTDGKTTTTALLAKMLIDAEFNPTVVLGSKANFLEDNWRVGESEYFVFEADEYRRAFDNYTPKLAVITNIGLDHLDYYTDQVDYTGAFKSYLKKLPKDGFAIINNDNDNAIEAALKCSANVVTFGLEKPADFAVTEIEVKDGRQEFSVMEFGTAQATISLPLPGKYNVANSLAAIAAARTLGVSWDSIIKSLDGFQGVWRRFETLGQCGRAKVIADYAHTPDAVAKVIKATKDFYPDKKILTVFQPHQYARTKKLFDGFVEAFDEAASVILPDIFYVEGRENPADFDVSSEKLGLEVALRGVAVEAPGDLVQSETRIRELANEFDVILILGAGNVYEIAKNLVK